MTQENIQAHVCDHTALINPADLRAEQTHSIHFSSLLFKKKRPFWSYGDPQSQFGVMRARALNAVLQVQQKSDLKTKQKIFQ